jgi:hypothetical protein
MPLDIKMPDGTNFNINADDNAQARAIMAPNMPPVRTVATVATELEQAIALQTSLPAKVKALTEELQTLLGKKRRGPRKP